MDGSETLSQIKKQPKFSLYWELYTIKLKYKRKPEFWLAAY